MAANGRCRMVHSVATGLATCCANNTHCSGDLDRLIDDDGISGVTSNPSTFRRAVAEDPSYRSDIRRLHADGATARDIYEQLVLQDVRDAGDDASFAAE